MEIIPYNWAKYSHHSPVITYQSMSQGNEFFFCDEGSDFSPPKKDRQPLTSVIYNYLLVNR